jgi:hypothetical protein
MHLALLLGRSSSDFGAEQLVLKLKTFKLFFELIGGVFQGLLLALLELIILMFCFGQRF